MATARKAPAGAVAVVPRAQVQLPAAVQERMTADIAAFQERMNAPTGTRIAVTQDKHFKNALDEKFKAIQGVIVNFVAKKAWYQDPFDKDERVPPNCFAIGTVSHNELEPSENSPDIQSSEGCRTCPKNQFKSAANGKGKACKDSYVLALLPPDAALDGADSSLVTLEISATGITPFEKYVRALSRDYGKAPYAFVTGFGFEPTVDYPSVRCVDPQPADVELVTMALDHYEEALKMLLTEPDVSEFDTKVRNKNAPPAAAKKAAPRR